jgi:hypothetical protein
LASNRDSARKWSQFSDHELCHIRVSRSIVEDIVRRQVQRRADNRDPRPRALVTPIYFNRRVTQALVFRKIYHRIVSFALRFPVHVLGSGEKADFDLDVQFGRRRGLKCH